MLDNLEVKQIFILKENIVCVCSTQNAYEACSKHLHADFKGNWVREKEPPKEPLETALRSTYKKCLRRLRKKNSVGRKAGRWRRNFSEESCDHQRAKMRVWWFGNRAVE